MTSILLLFSATATVCDFVQSLITLVVVNFLATTTHVIIAAFDQCDTVSIFRKLTFSNKVISEAAVSNMFCMYRKYIHHYSMRIQFTISIHMK